MADWQTGRIIRALSGFYTVSTPAGLVECKARGHFRKEHCTPLVGDVAEISVTGKTGMVERLAPRRNSFVRPAVANIDCLVLLAANVNPVTDPVPACPGRRHRGEPERPRGDLHQQMRP